MNHTPPLTELALMLVAGVFLGTAFIFLVKIIDILTK